MGYVKKNAVAGRTFATWPAFEAHLDRWTREIADARIHGTTQEQPIERFERDEAKAMKDIGGIGPFQATRELTRMVQSDCSVEVGTNFYSVPWRLIGDSVRVLVTAETGASITPGARSPCTNVGPDGGSARGRRRTSTG